MLRQNKVSVIKMVKVPKVKLIVLTLEEKVLATNKLSLAYFIFLCFKIKFNIKSVTVKTIP